MEKPILSNPENNRCHFQIGNDHGIEFHCYPQFVTNLMVDMLTACLVYLQTGAAAVNLDCGGLNYTLVFAKYMMHIIDENELQVVMYNFPFVSALDACRNILQCYLNNENQWCDLDYLPKSSEGISDEPTKKYEEIVRKKLNLLAKEISRYLPNEEGEEEDFLCFT